MPSVSSIIDVRAHSITIAVMRLVVMTLVVVLAAGCGEVAQGPDLAVPASDLAVVDLAPSGCPPAPVKSGACHGVGTVCRYPTDAGPYDHIRCNGTVWQPGNCPFGPGWATEFSGCTGPCEELFGEAITTCSCLPNGKGVCCVDTGGLPNCGNFDDGT